MATLAVLDLAANGDRRASALVGEVAFALLLFSMALAIPVAIYLGAMELLGERRHPRRVAFALTLPYYLTLAVLSDSTGEWSAGVAVILCIPLVYAAVLSTPPQPVSRRTAVRDTAIALVMVLALVVGASAGY